MRPGSQWGATEPEHWQLTGPRVLAGLSEGSRQPLSSQYQQSRKENWDKRPAWLSPALVTHKHASMLVFRMLKSHTANTQMAVQHASSSLLTWQGHCWCSYFIFAVIQRYIIYHIISKAEVFLLYNLLLFGDFKTLHDSPQSPKSTAVSKQRCSVTLQLNLFLFI